MTHLTLVLGLYTFLSVRSERRGAVMTRTGRRDGPARRQCAPRMERREAQPRTQPGARAFARRAGSPDRKGGLKGPRKPLAPPGAPFPPLLGEGKRDTGLPGADQRARAIARGQISNLILRSPPKRSEGGRLEGWSRMRASWFETRRSAALLTMRRTLRRALASPQPRRRDIRTLPQRFELQPHRRLDHPFAVGEGAEAAIG